MLTNISGYKSNASLRIRLQYPIVDKSCDVEGIVIGIMALHFGSVGLQSLMDVGLAFWLVVGPRLGRAWGSTLLLCVMMHWRLMDTQFN